ncbi:MAG TPA: polysaccharide deacetylase family protein [Candidatus Dormibacteraeota bacterium]|jgi:peptidoglycan/xylan/chitin deacetylase (PgdA/CDA1 family)|nr:polysaccharide deacetylase family protein [Candidatus Dormibacteraeota bacterium]
MDLANQASVLLVISFSLAAISFFGLRIANRYGLVGDVLSRLPRVQAAAAAHAPAGPAGGAGATAAELTDLPQPATPQLGALAKPAVVRAGTWLPVLMYHYVRVAPAGDRAGFNLSVTPENFAAQMRYLRDHGYHTLTMAQADQALLRSQPLPAKPVVLTFDDGYRDFYTTAAPIMRSLGITATAYIPTSLLDGKAYMTWAEVRELDGQGFEMAAHTEFHVDLAKAADARARIEVFGSKDALESHLGHPVVDFCYPYGGFNYKVMALVQEAGFLSATTTQVGGWHNAQHMFDMSRVRVSGGETLEAFARYLDPFETPTPAPTASASKSES